MSLYGNKKRLSALNSNVNKKPNSLLSAKTDTPYRTNDVLSENEVSFRTATPSVQDNFKKIKESLSYIKTSNLPGTCFKSINSGVYAPIALGSLGSPDPEFLYANPRVYNPQDNIFGDITNTSNCEKIYMMANIQGSVYPTCSLPNSGISSKSTTNNTINVSQKCTPNIIISSGFNVSYCGIGVNFLSETKEIDTWYNGNFNSIAIGNVGIGTQNWNGLDSAKNISKSILDIIPERYTWQFGTIWFFKGINNISRMEKNTIDSKDYIDNYIKTGKLSLTCDSSCGFSVQISGSNMKCSDGIDISSAHYTLEDTNLYLLDGLISDSDKFLNQSLTRVFPNILIEYNGCDIFLRNYIYDVATVDVTNIINENSYTFCANVSGGMSKTLESLFNLKGFIPNQNTNTTTNTVFYKKVRSEEAFGRPLFTFYFKCFIANPCLQINSEACGKVIVVSAYKCKKCNC